MNTTSSNTYTLLTAETNFDTFLKQFSEVFTKYENQNIVVNLSSIEASEAQIQLLETYATQQTENNQSFVVVVPSFDADAFEEILNVVPTLTEAQDIIDMDEMTRDLGF